MDIFKVRPIIVNLDKTEHNIINMHQVKEVSTHTGNPTMMMLVIEDLLLTTIMREMRV
jgi:hypothetical protein